MPKKNRVAVIDIGSSKISAVVAERGVNKTFLIKGRYEYSYEGFADGIFFEEKKVIEILKTAVDDIKKLMGEKPQVVYVGVPGDFTCVSVKDSQISFSAKKKIKPEDIDALFDAAFVLKSERYSLINRSAIAFELDDFRRLASPVGQISSTLKGKLSFILCDKYFIDRVVPTIKDCGVKNVECVSTALAETLYLVDAESRDRISMILDVGYISSTFSIIQGDGIVLQKSFQFGGGYVTAGLSEKYELAFDVAEQLKRKVNICSMPSGACDYIECDNGEYYPMEEVKENIIESLDMLCENLDQTLEQSPYTIPAYVPLLLCGGGITFIRGAKEHLSNRLGVEVRTISPNVPLQNSPDEASILSLLDLALEQQNS